MALWLNNSIGIIGILVGSFIAYHVYFLSKRIDFKDKLVHKDNIRSLVEPILHKISKGYNRDAELINVKKYYTHYPHDNEHSRHGYTYMRGELKALRYDGIEFFCNVREVYIKPDGSFTLSVENGLPRAEFNIFDVGVIPYEWIEFVDSQGDEFSWRPQFFTKFKGPNKSPYKYIVHYRNSDTYQDGDPMDFKYRRVDVDNN